MGSFFPRALVFKEWRQQWSWAVLLFIVVGTFPFLSIVLSLSHLWDGRVMREEAVHSLRLYLSYVLGVDPNHSGADAFGLLPYGSAVLGATVLAHERSQGGLWYTLSGPVTRREVLRVKAFVGWLQVAAIVTVCALALVLVNEIADLNFPFGEFTAWWARHLFVNTAMFMAGLFAATLVGNVFAAAFAGIAVAVAPYAFGTFLEIVTELCTPRGLYPGRIAWTDVFGNLSPLKYIAGWGSYPPLLVVAGLALWSFIAYLVAQRLFFLTAAEHMANFFIFPVLWKWFVCFVCLVIGLALTVLSTRGYPVTPVSLVVRYAIFFALCWLVATGLIRLYRKKFLEV